MEPQRKRQYSQYRSNYRPRQVEEKTDIRETILLQCTVSGIILLAALILCLVNLPFSNELRVSLKQAISQETTPENIEEFVSGITGKVDDVQNSMKSIFDGTPVDNQPESLSLDSEETDVSEKAFSELEENQQPSINILPTAEPTPAPSSDVRIDEDILQQLHQSNQDLGITEKK